jgi:RNA polymerase sigma factor (sigma-70 family)
MHRVGGDLRAQSDAELITGVRAGSDAAFGVLYERHSGAARAAARSLGASRSDTDDLVSEAFVRVLSALQRGGGPEVAFRPYLMTCVRNAWYDKARKDGRVDVPGEVPEDVNLALLNVPPDSEDARMVAAAFASLPERWQMVLWHTEVEGRPAADVAPLLGIAPNAVAALAYRAREGLRQAYLQAHLRLPPPEACRDTVAKLGAYVRDGLSARDRRKVDEHLKSCERCTALLLELQEVSSSLRGVLVPILLGVSGTAFLAHLGAAGGGLAGLLHWRPRGTTARVGVVAAMGAVLVVGIVAASALTRSGNSERISATATSTAVVASSPSSSPPSVPAVVTAPVASSAPVSISPASAARSAPPFLSAPPTTSRASVSVVPFVPRTTAPSRVVRTTIPSTLARPTTTIPSTTAPTTTTPATTTTAPPATTTTVPATTTPTAAPLPTTTVPASVSLSITARAVGPAYAGLSASVDISAASGPLSGASTGGPLTAQATVAGPATLTVAGAPVADWGVAGCIPGATCLLPSGAAHVTIRLDLTGVAAGTTVPVAVTTSASGATAATANVTLTVAPRPAGLTSAVVDHGGLAMAANTVLTCLGPANGCGKDNNDTDLGYVDIGSGDTFNASAADLVLPPGATVTHAVLQWGGVPADAPDPDHLGTVMFTGPDGAVIDLPAAAVRRTGDAAYVATVDATRALQRLTRASGTYQVADVQTGTGPAQFGGWSLTVAYHLDAAPLRLIAIFDDPSADPATLGRVDAGDPRTYQLTGLTPPAQAASVDVAVTALDGDRALKGDTLKVGTVVVGDPDNFFASVISDGGAPRMPQLDHEYGFDAHLVSVPGGQAAGATSVTIRASSGGDNFFLGPVVAAVAI